MTVRYDLIKPAINDSSPRDAEEREGIADEVVRKIVLDLKESYDYDVTKDSDSITEIVYMVELLKHLMNRLDGEDEILESICDDTVDSELLLKYFMEMY